MKTLRIVSKLLALALLAGSAGGCPFPVGECSNSNQPIPPGTAAPSGVNPGAGVNALRAHSVFMRWVQLDEVTTLTITTTAATDQPTLAETSCSGEASGYRVPGLLTLETADGRLRAIATTTFDVDARGALRTPVWVSAGLPPSTLVGKGVVSDSLLETGGRVQVNLELVAAGANVSYGGGSILLSGNDSIYLADIGVMP